MYNQSQFCSPPFPERRPSFASPLLLIRQDREMIYELLRSVANVTCYDFLFCPSACYATARHSILFFAWNHCLKHNCVRRGQQERAKADILLSTGGVSRD